MTISLVVATHNEGNNLERCLEYAKHLYQELIIVDGESTDQTLTIAKNYKAKIIQTSNKPNFHINKKIGIDAATKDWILQLDADEVLTPELVNEIKQKVLSKVVNGYWIPRSNYFLGRFLTKGGQYPDYTMRLYRRGFGNLPAKDVHEQAVVQGDTAYLTNPMLHYGTPDFENYLLRFNRYTSLIAGELLNSDIKFTIFNTFNYLFIKPSFEFIRLYIRHKGFVDGFPGFVFALFSGLRFAIAYIKLWQLKYYPTKL